MNLTELIRHRDAKHRELREYLDNLERSGRKLAGATRTQYDRELAELEDVDSRIAELRDVEERNRQADAVRAEFRPVSPEANGGSESDLGAFLARGGPRTLEVSPPAGFSMRELTVGASAAGGNTVPTSFYGRLVAHMIEAASIMQVATVLTTESGEDLQVPKTTAHSNAALVAEGATIGESDPTFGQTTLGSFKYGVQIQASHELVEDSGVDLQGYLARQTGRALGNAFGNHAAVGDGSGKPRGVVTAATIGVTGATAGGAFTADELIDLYHSVIPQYRASANAAWLMNDNTWSQVRKLKDGNGDYLIGSLSGDATPMLLGKRVVIDPNVPDVGLSAKSVAFGDFAAYFVRQVRGIRFERSDDFAFGSDLVTYRALWRGDGDLVDELGAIKTFAGSAT